MAKSPSGTNIIEALQALRASGETISHRIAGVFASLRHPAREPAFSGWVGSGGLLTAGQSVGKRRVLAQSSLRKETRRASSDGDRFKPANSSEGAGRESKRVSVPLSDTSESIDATTPGVPGRRLTLFLDSKVEQVVRHFARRFPNIPDASKVEGFKAFVEKSREFYDELQPLYTIFLAWWQFSAEVLNMVKHMESLSNLMYESCPDIVTIFMDVIAELVAAHIIVNKMNLEAKAIVAAFAQCSAIQGTPIEEKKFTKLAALLQTTDRPIQVLSEMLHPQLFSVMRMIHSAKSPFLLHGPFSSAEDIRRTGTFALAGMGSHGQPINAVFDNAGGVLFHTRTSKRLRSILLTILLLRKQLAKDEVDSEFLKLLGQSGTPTIRLARNLALDFDGEMERLMSLSTKISKARPQFVEAFGDHLIQCIRFRDARRHCIRFLMKRYLHFARDRPSFVLPKLPLFIALVDLAREEVLLYFEILGRLVYQDPRKLLKKNALRASSKKGQQTALSAMCSWSFSNVMRPSTAFVHDLWAESENVGDVLIPPIPIHSLQDRHAFEDACPKPELSEVEEVNEGEWEAFESHVDPNIIELIGLAMELRSIILDQKNAFEQWCNEEEQLELAKDVLSKVVSENEDAEVRSFMQGQFEKLETVFDIPKCWMEVQLFQASRPLPVLDDVEWKTLQIVAYRANLLDDYDTVVSTSLSFKELFFHKKSIIRHLSLAFDLFVQATWRTDRFSMSEFHQIRYVGRMMELADDFAQNLPLMLAAEDDEMIEASQVFVDQICCTLAWVCCFWIHQRGLIQAQLGSLCGSIRPGVESTLVSSTSYQHAHEITTYVNELLYALNHPEAVVVYDVTFQPIEYFYQAFSVVYSFYLQNNVYMAADQYNPIAGIPNQVKPPSRFRTETDHYLHGLQSFSGLGSQFDQILTLTVAMQTSPARCRDLMSSTNELAQSKRTEGAKKAQDRGPVAQPYLASYAAWFRDFAVVTGTPGSNIMYSCLRNRFVPIKTVTNSLYQPEEMTLQNELRELCKLLGPTGFRFMEQHLLAEASTVCSRLDGHFQAAKQGLSGLEEETDIQVVIARLKRMKSVPSGLNVAITLGNLMFLRNLLLSAMSDVMAECQTAVFNVLKYVSQAVEIKQQTRPKGELTKEETFVKHLALTVGQRSSQLADGRLQVLVESIRNHATAESLPVFMAACILYVAVNQQEDTYISQLDLCSDNEHCLAMATAVLLENLGDSSQSAEKNHRRFFTLASRWLLQHGLAIAKSKSQKTVTTKRTLANPVLMVMSKYASYVSHIDEPTFERCLGQSYVDEVVSVAARSKLLAEKSEDMESDTALNDISPPA